MAENIITEKFFYGPETKDEYVFYDATPEKTECTGNLLAQAKEKNWYAWSNTSIVFKPLSEKEVAGLPQHYMLNPSSDASIKIRCEPVTVIAYKDIFETQDNADQLFANAYVWNSIPQAQHFVFPLSTGSINTLNRNNRDGHALVGIATPGSQEGIMEISVWDPCGETEQYFKHAHVIAAAFNKMSPGKLFVPKTQWDGKARTAMDCGPQLAYPKNGYCQTISYIKVRDIVQNGFPGKLITESDWKEQYPGLKDLHSQSAKLMYPSAPQNLTRNDLMPSAAGRTWMWMVKRYSEISASNSQFAVMLPKERTFEGQSDGEKKTDFLAAATTGGRALEVTVERSLEWDPSSEIPKGVKENPEMAERVRIAATDNQKQAIMKKALQGDIENFNTAALKCFFHGRWGGRWITKDPVDPQRRIEIIRYITELGSSDDPEWDAEDAAGFIKELCNSVWGVKNKQQTLEEFEIIENHDRIQTDEDQRITEYFSKNLLRKVENSRPTKIANRSSDEEE